MILPNTARFSYSTESAGTALDSIHSLFYLHSVILSSSSEEMQSIMMNMSVVCLSVCLSVGLHNSKNTRPTFTKFLRMLPVAMAWSFSDGVAKLYVLLVL